MCLTWYLLLLTLSSSYAARILGVFPMASYSHQIVYRPIWRELAARGHDLVILTADTIDEPDLPNLKQIDLHFSYKLIENFNLTSEMSNWNVINKIYATVKLISDIAEAQLSHPEVQALIKNETEHFDLLMIEFMQPSMLAFKHRFNCPTIGLSSLDAVLWGHEATGNPTHPILYPDFSLPFSRNLHFFQRIFAVLFAGFMKYFGHYIYIPMETEVVEKYFGKGYPNLYELGLTIDMMFINVNPVIHGIRPITPSTISIGGGIHINPPKPLPNNIQIFLDNAKTGAIYFSLGSNIKSKSLSLKTKQVLLEAFRNMPQYQILWKFEDTELEGKPENVKIVQWAPQQDILRHPNIKLFITQGGLQSLDETIHNRVPFIGMPFFGDQIFNVLNAEENGVGVFLEHDKITAEGFKNTVVDVITNPKYKNNIVKWAKLIKDEPMTGLEKAIWWTEFVLRNKETQHLKGPENTIPLYQYYYIDIIAFLSFIVFCLCIISYLIVKITIRLIMKFLKKDKKVKSS